MESPQQVVRRQTDVEDQVPIKDHQLDGFQLDTPWLGLILYGLLDERGERVANNRCELWKIGAGKREVLFGHRQQRTVGCTCKQLSQALIQRLDAAQAHPEDLGWVKELEFH